MAQGLFGGATDYSVQSPQDILKDINNWILLANTTKAKISAGIEDVQNSSMWQSVPFNFQMTLKETIDYCNTIIGDLGIVKDAVERDCITKSEVSLLERIGENAVNYNNSYGKDYNEDTRAWHRHSNSDFKIIEQMYADGRDFFVTLQDALNAASRLEDYMKTGNVMNLNIGGDVSGSQIQFGTVNSSQNMVNSPMEIPYEKVLNVLTEISKYKDQISEEFKENGKPFCDALDEAVNETKKKGNSDTIKQCVNVMKDLAMRVSSSLVVEGIKNLLKTLPF